MSLTYLAVFAAALLIAGLLLSGLFIWLACRMLKAPGVGYGSALGTALLIWVVNFVFLLAVSPLTANLPQAFRPLAVLALLVGELGFGLVAVPLVCLKLFLGRPRISFGKAALVWVIWLGLQAVTSVALFFGLRTQAEAFVIPTGGMAETLRGYHKLVECPKCGYQFPVNASVEAEPQDDRPFSPVTGCTCPNCRYHIDFGRDFAAPPTLEGGDRVLAGKGRLLGGGQRERFDVLVFDYPREPVRRGVPMRYIKRLIGLGGETIGIHGGKLYVATGIDYKEDAAPEDLWQPQYMHPDEHKEALEDRARPKPGMPQFHILRKPPEKVLALRHIVYDNDHPAKDIAESRWAGREDGGAWVADGTNGFRHKPQAPDQMAWLGYQHLLRGGNNRPELITDFIGYDTWEVPPDAFQRHEIPPQNWVGDLILDVEVAVEEAKGELVLELGKGADRFEAHWDLDTGACTLHRRRAGKEEKLEEGKQTALQGKGTHRLRFANVDERLTVWVDDALTFGDGVAYDATVPRGPTADDLKPVRIGVKNATVSVHHLKLWRDTYYTINPSGPDGRVAAGFDWSDPEDWRRAGLESLPGKTLYVQPGHYLCLGDNSPESSDSRVWGLVPERLVIGRAVSIYYPFARAGPVP